MDKITSIKPMNLFSPKQAAYAALKQHNITLTNDKLFGYVLHDEEICKGFLSLLLGIQITEFQLLEWQHTVEAAVGDQRGIRLDISATDSNGNTYDIEMERSRISGVAKRSRYYTGMIDAEILKKSDSFEALKESYIIFICSGDPFTAGLSRYTFRYTCAELPGLLLGDATTKIFLNTKATNVNVPAELEEVLHYIEHTTLETERQLQSSLAKRMAERVVEVMENSSIRKEIVDWSYQIQQNIEEGIGIGREEGIEIGRKEGVQQERDHLIANYILKRKNRGRSREETAFDLADDFNLSQQETDSYLAKHWD